MQWQNIVDPRAVYEAWSRVSAILEPRDGVLIDRDLAGSVEAGLSLLSARQAVWATTCLAAGYGSRTSTDTGVVAVDLGATDPTAWPTAQGITHFCAAYENLGWSPEVIVSCARAMTAVVSPAVLTLAGFAIPDLQTCFALYGNDHAALERCLKQAVEATTGAATAHPAL